MALLYSYSEQMYYVFALDLNGGHVLLGRDRLFGYLICPEGGDPLYTTAMWVDRLDIIKALNFYI